LKVLESDKLGSNDLSNRVVGRGDEVPDGLEKPRGCHLTPPFLSNGDQMKQTIWVQLLFILAVFTFTAVMVISTGNNYWGWALLLLILISTGD
jgi:hypothetical protein